MRGRRRDTTLAVLKGIGIRSDLFLSAKLASSRARVTATDPKSNVAIRLADELGALVSLLAPPAYLVHPFLAIPAPC